MVELIGILNVTPDSFSDGGKFLDPTKAVAQANKLFADGANIVDIGAEATNPFVEPISANEEWDRLKEVLPALMEQFPGRLSLDTYHPQTAQKALDIGPIIINDVTTFRDSKLIEVVARHKAKCIVSHMPLAATSINDAHSNFHIDNGDQVKDELLAQRHKLLDAGLPPQNIILDPGIGFGKTMRLNWELLSFAKLFPTPQAIALGHSRKRFLATDEKTGKPLPEPEKLKNSRVRNLKAAGIAITASKQHKFYLRVHDVSLYDDLQV